MMLKTHTDNSVKRARNAVNSRHSAVSRRLTPYIARAARSEPAKVLALKTGISASEIRDLREERRMPSVPTFFALALHDPALKAQVLAILAGEGEAADPANIQAIIKFLGEKLR